MNVQALGDQSSPKMSQSFFLGISLKDPLSGKHGVLHQLTSSHHRLGLGEVIDQVTGVGLSNVPVHLFQTFCDPGVQTYAAAGGHLLRQSLLNQRVAELVSVNLTWYALYQMNRHRLVQRLEQLVLGHFGAENTQQPEIKLPSDDRSGGQHLIATLGQPVETLPNHIPDALGDSYPVRRASVNGRQFSAFRQQTDGLGHEKRVAFSVRVKGFNQP